MRAGGAGRCDPATMSDRSEELLESEAEESEGALTLMALPGTDAEAGSQVMTATGAESLAETAPWGISNDRR